MRHLSDSCHRPADECFYVFIPALCLSRRRVRGVQEAPSRPQTRRATYTNHAGAGDGASSTYGGDFIDQSVATAN